MSSKRLVDGALVVLALLVLGAGVTYWLVAAPADDAVGALRDAVEQQMPVTGDSELFETVTLSAPDEASWPVSLNPGQDYQVVVVCAGDGYAEIQLTLSPVPMVCQPTGHRIGTVIEGTGARTPIGVRAVDGGPLVIGIQVTPG